MNENGSKSPKIVIQMKQIESKSTKKVSIPVKQNDLKCTQNRLQFIIITQNETY